MKITKSHFRVLSAICSNLVVVWFAASLATQNTLILLRNLIFIVVFWYLAVKSETLATENE